MRRALGKAHPRVVGIDDGAFERGDRYAPIAAVVLSSPDHVEAAALSRVRVDGRDGTARIIALFRAVTPPEGVRAILLDGAVVGGFNVLDLDAIHRATSLPVVAVTRRRPDFSRIRSALGRWFPRTAAARLALLRRHRLFRVPTGGAPIWATASGCTAADAVWLVRRTSVVGFWPEPLRVAHLVASAAGTPGNPPNRTLKGRRLRPVAGPVA
ncbi:MAG TPA: DUF99 family protein [Thermoplasmata archaeon]|nr:DUF99 family protein [Thermoplasmata archaeon]